MKRGWHALGFAPGQQLGLEVGHLWEIGAELRKYEAASQESMKQGPSRDGSGASEGERGVNHLCSLCFPSEP